MGEARIRKRPLYRSGRGRAATHYLPEGDAPAADVHWGICYAPASHVSASVADREAVLLDTDNGRTYTLNPVGTLVWELLDGRRPLGALVEALAEQFDAPEGQLRRDLIELVRRLEAERLIEERHQAGR